MSDHRDGDRIWYLAGRLIAGGLAALGWFAATAFAAKLDLNSSAQYYRPAPVTACNSARIGATVDPIEEPILPVCSLGCEACLKGGKCSANQTNRCAVASSAGEDQEPPMTAKKSSSEGDGLLIMRSTSGVPAGGILPTTVSEDHTIVVIEIPADQELDLSSIGGRELLRVDHDGIAHLSHAADQSGADKEIVEEAMMEQHGTQ
ncbi:MAG: hypothetical protein ACOYKZ_01290 [Chlamydiia bacterium]